MQYTFIDPNELKEAIMDNFGYVLATKMLVDNNHKVRFMYREEVTNPQDSGWRFSVAMKMTST